MGKIRVRVKAPFGEIVVEGESAQEILKTIKANTINNEMITVNNSDAFIVN